LPQFLRISGWNITTEQTNFFNLSAFQQTDLELWSKRHSIYEKCKTGMVLASTLAVPISEQRLCSMLRSQLIAEVHQNGIP